MLMGHLSKPLMYFRTTRSCSISTRESKAGHHLLLADTRSKWSAITQSHVVPLKTEFLLFVTHANWTALGRFYKDPLILLLYGSRCFIPVGEQVFLGGLLAHTWYRTCRIQSKLIGSQTVSHNNMRKINILSKLIDNKLDVLGSLGSNY